MPTGELTPSTEGTEVLWGVADCQVAVDRALAKGATLLSAPRAVGGDIVVAAVRDPFGNRLGFIVNPHFKG
jgi:lactoylglutathione lyase